MSMQSGHRDELRAWLALRMVKGVGPVVYQGLLRAFAEPMQVFAATAHALECAGVRPDVARAIRRFSDWQAADRQLAAVQRAGAHLVTCHSPTYPPSLREIHDPPPLLYVKGELGEQDRIAVAVVGSRRASEYGLRMAREIAAGLVRCGVTVVSGLARGTDAQAHWAALRGGGRTIAVLGSGVDVVYPSEHRALSQKIAQQGAVVSELPMGTQPDAENFPARNRIISGLSLGTLVVEAAEKSGSLITARFALEQGRDVFALPGLVGQGTRGTHSLLRDGAKLTERAEDIVEELAPQLLQQARRASAVVLSSMQHRLIESLRGGPVHIDVLTERTGLSVPVVMEALLGLELQGVVEQLPGKYFLLNAVDVESIGAKEG